MRPSTSILAEERSMMNTILAGKDASFCTGLGIVLTPFAKNVCSVIGFDSRRQSLKSTVRMVSPAVRTVAVISTVTVTSLTTAMVSSAISAELTTTCLRPINVLWTIRASHWIWPTSPSYSRVVTKQSSILLHLICLLLRFGLDGRMMSSLPCLSSCWIRPSMRSTPACFLP